MLTNINKFMLTNIIIYRISGNKISGNRKETISSPTCKNSLKDLSNMFQTIQDGNIIIKSWNNLPCNKK